MRFAVERATTIIVLVVAMMATVALIGAATDLRGLMAGLAFWPLLPYLLLLVVTSRPATREAAVAGLAASVAAAGVGVGAYFIAFVRTPSPPGPLVLVLVPLGQLVAAALILGGAFVLTRWRRGRWQ